VMEVQNLRVGDLFIRSNMSSVHVRNGKGGKRRDVYINTELKQECIEFLQIRKEFGLPYGYNDFAFCSDNGKPVTTRCLQKAFKGCLKKLKSSLFLHLPVFSSHTPHIRSPQVQGWSSPDKRQWKAGVKTRRTESIP
ncbi:MAG: site-specific integrase, partial [Spirochaetia bacterium]|nr:site-specific integrase [Spirochaetia bacterium]